MPKLSTAFQSADVWCQFGAAKDVEDAAISWDDPNACRWCLSGMIRKVASSEYASFNMHRACVGVIRRLFPTRHEFGQGPVYTVSEFNDHPDTVFADMLKVADQITIE